MKNSSADWRQQFAKYFPVVIGLIALTSLVVAAFAPDGDPDLFWHLRLGRDLLDFHLSPYIDRISYTYNGQHLSQVPWLFELTAYGFYKYAGGLFGLQVMKAIIWLVAVALMLVFCIRLKLPALFTFSFVTVMTYANQIKFFLRPDILSLALYPAVVAIVYSLLKEWTWRKIWIIAFGFMLWTNWHTSSVFGYCVLGAAFLQRAFEMRKDRKAWKTLGAQGLAAFLPGFLNPAMNHPFLFFTRMEDDWRFAITELRPPDIVDYTAVDTALLALSLFAVIYFLRQKRYFEAICISFFSFQSLKVIRMVVINIILLSPFLVIAVLDIWNHLRNYKIKRVVRYALMATLLIPTYLASNFIFKSLSHSYFAAFPPNSSYPFDLLEQDKNLNRPQNAYVDYTLGGWFSFYLPEVKLYIDGRTNILYPLPHLRNYLYYRYGRKPISDLNADVLALRITTRDVLIRSAILKEKYKVRWLSNSIVVLTRDDTNFRTLTQLWVNPSCFDAIKTKDLQDDLAKAHKINGEKSNVTEILNSLLEIKNLKKDAIAITQYYKSNQQLLDQWDIPKRVLGHVAKKIGSNESAVAYFMTTNNRLDSDIYSALEASVPLQDAELASPLLKLIGEPHQLTGRQLNTVLKAVEMVKNKKPDRVFDESKIQIYKQYSEKLKDDLTTDKCDLI